MNLSQVTAGEAQASEAAELADFSRRCFLDTYAVFNTPANLELFLAGPMDRTRLMAEVTGGDLLYLVLRLEGRIVAYAVIHEAPLPGESPTAGVWEILRLYADKSVIGFGLGRQLMEYCLETIRSRGGQRVWLGVWEHNGRAMGFYEKMGFKRTGEHLFMLGNDAQRDWIMQRAIPAAGLPIFAGKSAV